MGEIKSAWEIAQQKAEKLGKLSAEEIRKEREERANSMGKALAEKYLVKPDLRELTEALNSHKGEEGEIIRQATVTWLVEAIELKSQGKLKELSQSLFILVPGEEIHGIWREIECLFEEYRQAEQTVKQQIDRAGRETLHQLRISGTAIAEINPQAKEKWRKVLDEFSRPFQERLYGLKQKLLQRSISSFTPSKKLQGNFER